MPLILLIVIPILVATVLCCIPTIPRRKWYPFVWFPLVTACGMITWPLVVEILTPGGPDGYDNWAAYVFGHPALVVLLLVLIRFPRPSEGKKSWLRLIFVGIVAAIVLAILLRILVSVLFFNRVGSPFGITG